MRHIHNWSDKDDAMLGVMSDFIAAQKIGCTERAVASRRRKLLITTFKGGSQKISVAELIRRLLEQAGF